MGAFFLEGITGMSERVFIFDTTLRDGEQSPGCSMNLEEKISMAKQLDRLKVDIIEAGFPIASDGDFEAVREISKVVENPVIAALARTHRPDIERAWEALQHARKPRIHTFIATSDIHLKYKLRKTHKEVIDITREMVGFARELCDNIEFSAEDATRSNLDYLVEVVETAIEAGATTINIPDTVGYTVPREYEKFIRDIISRVSKTEGIIFSCHCHNDLGLGVANSLAAIDGGCRQVECTINGIGERAGNASLEEIVMTLKTRKDIYPYHTELVSEEIYRSSRLLTNLTGAFLQANKAIVGKNAFAHEAGIHQDGVLKEASTYEIMTPQSVGIPNSKLILGKHSGRHALKSRLLELGYDLEKEDLDRAYFFFTRLADQKKEVYDEDLIAILQDGIKLIPDTYRLKYVFSAGGTHQVSSAVVKLARGDENFNDSAHGDGPVDACYKAIDRITGIQGKLLEYTINSVTRGKDAVGEVFVHVEFGKESYSGKAASTDIIDASARAYLNALNKVLHELQRSKNT